MTHHQHEIVLSCMWTAVAFAVLCFVLGELTGNVSQVDARTGAVVTPAAASRSRPRAASIPTW